VSLSGVALPTGPSATLPVALLFPGQGSQAVGMISEATARIPAVAAMLVEARGVLGYDVLDLITQGRLGLVSTLLQLCTFLSALFVVTLGLISDQLATRQLHPHD
jgi:malonyl CoA-acyl carrier protein transacylase